MKKVLLITILPILLFVSCKKDADNSANLTVSEISLSQGLLFFGTNYYYPKNKKMTVYVDVTKDANVSGTYTFRQSVTGQFGNGPIVSSGTLDNSGTKTKLSLDFTPTESAIILLEVDVTAGSKTIVKSTSITVRDH